MQFKTQRSETPLHCSAISRSAIHTAKRVKGRSVSIFRLVSALRTQLRATLLTANQYFLLAQRKVIVSALIELHMMLQRPIIILEYQAWITGQPVDPVYYLSDVSSRMGQSTTNWTLNPFSDVATETVDRQKNSYILGSLTKLYR